MAKRSVDVAVSYVRDFSQQAESYKNFKLEETLVLLNRSASLLSTAIQPQHFCPNSLEISKFFVDLHAVIEVLNPDTDVMWACITVLQHCSKNLDARRAIVNDYRFVPLLAYVLKRTSAQDKVQRLLGILQDLTYGISITWEEPYLTGLLEMLVQIIYSEEEAPAQLALSILINLCYKNFPVLFLFLRTVNISSFSRKITNFGVLANKMMIILSEDINSPEVKELHLFLKATFGTIDECMKTWNVPYLRHVIDFLLDSKSHKGLHMAMRTYETYCEDIEKLLDFAITAVVVLAVAMGVESSYIAGLELGNDYGYGASSYGLDASKVGYSGLGVAVGVSGQSLSQGSAVYNTGLYSAAIPAAVNVVSSPSYSYAAAPAAVNYASYAVGPAAVNVVSSPSYSYAAAPAAVNYASYAAAPAVVNIATSPVYAAAKIPAAVAVVPQATYVAKNRGAIHTAPLAGHVKSTASINVAPAPGTY